MKREQLGITELLTPNGNTIKFGTAAPTTGTWKVGDTVLNTVPVAGAAFAWSCSVAGTPGTWIEPPAMASVTATAAQLNYNAGVTAGTALASKTLVLGAAKEISLITTLGATTVNAVNVNVSTAETITSASAVALTVGLAGATNPAFVVDSSTATQAAGLKVTGAVAAGTVAAAVISSGADASLTVNAKGTGTVGIGTASTGQVSLGILAGTIAGAAYGVKAVSATTAGSVLGVSTTGVYTSTDGVFDVEAAALTSGVAQSVNVTGMNTGIGVNIKGTAATLTTGRYLSANDAATEVFGIGANGHLHSTVSAAPPTIVVTAQVGITAAAITAGGSDTCGVITTTGTSTGATILDVTFGKTYTVAPKFVIIGAANAAAAMPNTGYLVSAITATGFTITVAAGGTYAATPSFRYAVIA